MSYQIEKLEHNMAKLTIEVAAEEFDKAVDQAYNKQKNRINVPGFRKGKAPRKMIEKLYGAGVFFEDAANIVIPKAYAEALKECEETIVSRPAIDVTQIEPGKPFIFTAEVALKPEVVLGEYKGLEVKEQNTEVTELEVQAEIDKEREKNSSMINVDDRAVENGDIIKLNFEGSVDGVPFDGGKAEDYPLTIGSGSFIPGFEDQLIGAKIGEDVEVKVTFPEEYHAENLKGKEAVFACKVNAIQVKQLPEADDEFAQDVSDFDTMAEYRADIEKKLAEKKEAAAKNAIEAAAVEKAAENAQMDIPEAMVEDQAAQMMDDFARRIQSQGISMDQYMQFTGMDAAKLAEAMKPDALKRIKNSLVLEAVAKAENIEITEAQVDAEIGRMAEQYKMEAAKIREIMGAEQIENMKKDLAVRAAAEIIRDSAKAVLKEEATEE
ncbi:MAG: trigger factor [Lachnospiraceae bacterium]|nr:trigger factor [Lachnospiraceae bacterium]